MPARLVELLTQSGVCKMLQGHVKEFFFIKPSLQVALKYTCKECNKMSAGGRM